MRTIVTNPYQMLNVKNKQWVDSLHIPTLKEGIGIKHPADFLLTLSHSFFKDQEPFQPSKVTTEKKIQKELAYVRSIFEYYHITQPEHWSPIRDIGEVAIEDVSNKGVFSFNQAIDGLRNFLTATSEFTKTLKNDIVERSANCKNMSDEIITVSEECSFYDKKIESLTELANGLEDDELKSTLLGLLKE